MSDLLAARHWIFDLDGTLTVAVHDFDTMRAELGLPAGRPILEALGERPHYEARVLRERLDAMEFELARRARPAAGAFALLGHLLASGRSLGILTRNSRQSALETLRVSGLVRFFEPGDVISREAAEPKPSPAGIRCLLERWGATAADAVMVGDYLFDLLAGRAAGLRTVHVDPAGLFAWPEHADVQVQRLDALLRNVPPGPRSRPR